MKIEGYELIGIEEFNSLPPEEKALFQEGSPLKTYYFKKVQKFPICFEDNARKIEVEPEGIRINNLDDKGVVYFRYDESFPLLVKAVEKAKEVAKQNEK